MTPPVTSHRLANPLAVLLLSSLIAFTALAGGAGKSEDCHGNSPKKPCPTIEPLEGATVRGTALIRASVQANVTVAGILFELDGNPLAVEDTVAPYELNWDTTKTPNGDHSLTATVRLPDGGSSTGQNQVSVDNPAPDTTAPTAQLTAPASAATVSGSVSVTANATDNVGVAGVQFKLDGANLGGEDTSAPYSATWDTTTSSNAQHTLTAVARDAAGNTTTTGATTVTVKNSTSTPTDTTPPTAQLTAPAGGSTVTGSVNVNANATDNVGVAGVQFKLDGANLGAEDTTAPYTVAWDSKTASNAQHTLTAVARDAAGNRTTATNVTVTVSNTTAVPSSGSLRWPAPQLTSPQTIVIPERGGETWNLEAGKDYVVRFETGRRYGPLGFMGGRNIVLVGGEQIIDNTSSTDYRQRRLLVFRNQTGTIHIEGYLGTGPGLTEGINIWAPEAIL